MKQLTILGNEHILKEQKSDKDYIEHRSNTIIVNRHTDRRDNGQTKKQKQTNKEARVTHTVMIRIINTCAQ
jgi:hypothetical protein